MPLTQEVISQLPVQGIPLEEQLPVWQLWTCCRQVAQMVRWLTSPAMVLPLRQLAMGSWHCWQNSAGGQIVFTPTLCQVSPNFLVHALLCRSALSYHAPAHVCMWGTPTAAYSRYIPSVPSSIVLHVLSALYKLVHLCGCMSQVFLYAPSASSVSSSRPGVSVSFPRRVCLSPSMCLLCGVLFISAVVLTDSVLQIDSSLV
jgi:hypothetical protein